MANVYLLGTGASVSDAHRTTTMLALEKENSLLVVDCGGDVVQRLMMLGLDPLKLSALILTHEHADHVGGFPLFMQKIWLLGRREPIPVYGIRSAIDQARRIHEAFDTADWPDVPEILWYEVELTENAVVLTDGHWHVTASPGSHSVPVLGLRIEEVQAGGVLAYSCDTEYCQEIVRLSQGADILIHEATGAGPGHSCVEHAARAAKEAQVGQLLLVHLPPEALLDDERIEAAKSIFANLAKGQEGGCYAF